jgi:hypothetical protein
VAHSLLVEAPTGEDHAQVIKWYRERLSGPAVFPWKGSKYEPVLIGPTWQTHRKRWVLPEATIGWDALGWTGTELQHGHGQPWRYTDEQARWLLWWYAIDDDGDFLFRDGVLQRLKGWGKDPMAATLCAIEMIGPCRFAGWHRGRPVATDSPNAWIQSAAVSLEQTKNTMRLFPSLFTPEAVAHYRIQVGKEFVYALDDERMIQAVTSSPATLEGARATFVEKNETQHWTGSNEGHEMADVIERNATKSPDGGARALAITNAFEPGEDSVAQRDREAFEAAQAERAADVGLMYDSIEADAKAPLTAEAAPEVVESIRGDSVWLQPKRIVKSILDIRNPPSRSRRFWYNQITATEDAWVTPAEWDACELVFDVPVGDMITIGFDGSETDDHSALIGCHVATDHLFEIEVWIPPKDGRIDNLAVDGKVRETLQLFDVVGFYSDYHPFQSYVDRWAVDFGDDLLVTASPRQPIAFDIRGRLKQFTQACERLQAAIVQSAQEATAAAEEGRPVKPRLTQGGQKRFRQHVHNAHREPNPWGISVRKAGGRESPRKIDSVPAAVLARLARQDYLALPESKRKRTKKVGGRVF